MAANITDSVLNWLRSGGNRIGQIAIARLPEGSWELRHDEDAGRENLTTHCTPEMARHIANLDDRGEYRPLKTARNLAHGWRLLLPDAVAVRRALDYLYPAMTGVWHNYRRNRVAPVFLRETLARQTGMYRITQKVTDEEARQTIDRFCAGCLKHRLWEIDGVNPDPLHLRPDEIPLICHEACNLLVAEIRKTVKGTRMPGTAAVAP